MVGVVKNGDDLNIKNVICFFVSSKCPRTVDVVKKCKESGWTYQDYLTMACHKLKYKLIWLNKHHVSHTFDGNVISINDPISKNTISLNKDNTHDTIIFQGQSNDNTGINFESLMRAFEYMDFYMINTFNEIRMASDKLLSANLLSSKGIPQPKYILVNKNIIEDPELDGGLTREYFWDLLKSLNDNYTNINEEDLVNIKYVVKILNGSLGIGVFICTFDEIESIIQTLFVINEECELIIQEFKKNTGDIRAHAFSVDGKHYEILAAMKRNKIDGDFRSNVSLGATTSEINLTPEQKEIILDVARLSGCKWVGVDLMECEDGSNVVIEYNSSPGVQGISQQIKKNMFEIVLTRISDWFKDNPEDENPMLTYRKNTEAYSQYIPEVVEELVASWEGLSEKRLKVLNTCLNFVPGTQYKMKGKHSPELGLDCSGYVKRVFRDALDIDLPKMCVEYHDFREDNPYYPLNKNEELLPGDIGVLSTTSKNNHIGIYAGDGKWFENSVVWGVQLTNFKSFKYFFRIKNID